MAAAGPRKAGQRWQHSDRTLATLYQSLGFEYPPSPVPGGGGEENDKKSLLNYSGRIQNTSFSSLLTNGSIKLECYIIIRLERLDRDKPFSL
jgi:hypothetical protein